MSYLYCIQCELMDEVYQGTHRKIVEHEDYPMYWIEWQECSGPFSVTEPPVFIITDDEADCMAIPDADELALMNENASMLMADMEV